MTSDPVQGMGTRPDAGPTPWQLEPDLAALDRAYRLVEVDAATAIKDLRALAARGSTMSQVYLGNIYRRGEGGVSANLEESELWFRRAAEGGSLVALFHLAAIDLNQGRYAEGESTLKSAAKRNYSPAIYWLARLYWRGPKEWRRLPEARQLLEQAAGLGHIWAKRDLGKGYMAGTFGFRPLRGARSFLSGAYCFFREAQRDPRSQRLRRDGAWTE